jgi:5'-nucleotidase (lipoprotein e(P4) family)
MKKNILAFLLMGLGLLNTDAPSPNRQEHTVSALVWFQNSAEMRALYYQAYALAKLRLDEYLSSPRKAKPPAVIVDIDETIIDNGPHQAKLIQTNTVFPSYWSEWLDSAKAEALPGAVEFLSYAASKGVDVFYVSNHTQKELSVTLKNLRLRGFPQATEDHCLLMEKESTKEPRRLRIAETREIVLLCGDNLNDFSFVFERKSVADRFRATDSLKAEFGRRFIVLPNPLYGEWENAVYGYRRGLTDAQKDSLRKASLRGF